MGERSGAPSGFSPPSIVISKPPVAVQLPQPDVSANRDAPQWIRSASFSTNQRERKVKQVLGLVEGSFGFNLEVVAELDNGGLQHFYRDGSGWQSGPVFGTVN
jgi:hypothetical protein